MKYGYARVSTDGQSVDAQVRQMTKAGCRKVFRAKTDRAQLRCLLQPLGSSSCISNAKCSRGLVTERIVLVATRA
jgi:DNA invertase Pin-like site-specific DNA recombinase